MHVIALTMKNVFDTCLKSPLSNFNTKHFADHRKHQRFSKYDFIFYPEPGCVIYLYMLATFSYMWVNYEIWFSVM